MLSFGELNFNDSLNGSTINFVEKNVGSQKRESEATHKNFFHFTCNRLNDN